MLPSSTFSTPFSLAALEASLRRPPPKPQVPELRLMRPQDMGIPQQMQKEMGIAPEHACDRMNQGWQERYEAIHTQMSQVYESQQALFDVENTWHDLQGHLRALGSGPDSLWPQRTAVFGASGEPENAFMRVTCEPHTPLYNVMIHIKQLAQPAVMQAPAGIELEDPGTAMGLIGQLTLKGHTLDIAPEMSFAAIVVSLQLVGERVDLVVNPLIQRPISSTRPGLFKLHLSGPGFEGWDDLTDDQGGGVLKNLGWAQPQEITPATPAILEIDGLALQSESNTLTPLKGLNLTLKAPSPGPIGVRVVPPEISIAEHLHDFALQTRFLNQKLDTFCPTEPGLRGPLTGVFFLRRLNDDMQTLFTRRFGPGGALAAEDVGLKPLNGGVRFDPEVLRIAFQNPQKVERFFTRKHVPRDAMLMPMIIPPQISGTTHVRLTFQDQKIKVFLGSTRGDTKDTADPDKVQWTEGRLQEGVIVGKEHTAFEGMHLCLTTQAQEGLKKLQKEGDTLLTTLDTQAGFADDLLWTLTRYASEFQKTGQAHDARVAQGAQKITDIQKAIDQKRDQIKPGAARLQVAYVQAKMREKMNSQLMKSLWKGDGEG